MGSLFKEGAFKSSSGLWLPWKIDCDALTDDDWSWATMRVLESCDGFSAVEGIPRGGLKWADRLREYAEPGRGYPLLIVDDVLTTGASMNRLRAREYAAGRRNVIGYVFFARSPTPPWVKALCQLGV